MKPNFKKRKIRSKEHREFVASQPCMITGVTSDIHAYKLTHTDKTTCDSLRIPVSDTHYEGLLKCNDEQLYLDLWGVDYKMAEDMAEFLCMQSPCELIKEMNNGE